MTETSRNKPPWIGCGLFLLVSVLRKPVERAFVSFVIFVAIPERRSP
jgi:hypothetical protein